MAVASFVSSTLFFPLSLVKFPLISTHGFWFAFALLILCLILL